MSFAIVTWKARGSTPLPVEEVEVIKIQKLVIDGKAEEGAKCSMQFHQQMWHGEIHSLHGKLAQCNIVGVLYPTLDIDLS